MIISCPRCHKQYRLDASNLNYARLPDGSGQGLQLACSNCHEQWWEIKRDHVSQKEYQNIAPEMPFRNLTDISLLYQRQAHSYAYQASPALEPNISLSLRSEERNKILQHELSQSQVRQKKSGGIVSLAIWSIVIFVGIVGGTYLAMQIDPSFLKIFTGNTEQKKPKPGEISINSVLFEAKPINESKQRVIVVGNAKNSGPKAVTPQNIQLTAWGSCQQGQKPNEHGLCEVRTWSYQWKRDLIQPGEQLTFKSAAIVPSHLQIDHVNVATS